MKNLKLNSKLTALRFPLSLILFFFGKKERLQKKLLYLAFKKTFPSKAQSKGFERYWEEIISDDFVPMSLSKSKIAGNSLSTTFGKWIYIAVRAAKPEIMIETGVAHGYSSWVILNAIHKNQKGKLYSIDLAGHDTNDDYNLNKNKIGHIVPNTLRQYWKLIVGDSKIELPKLLTRLGKVDIFFHDSDHSFENMFFEFNEVFKFLKKDGIVLSNDIYKNLAFDQFIANNKLNATYFSKGGCIII